MTSRTDVFIIGKDTGTLLSKFSLFGSEETAKDQLVTGFLTALNSFAKELDFPAGVSLMRSGNIEARFVAGKYVFCALIIDYTRPLNSMTEPVVSGLAQEILITFEKTYNDVLKAKKTARVDVFEGFHMEISKLIDKYGEETMELYQKLLLIESLYAKVPQKWILPLIEKASEGNNILEELDEIPEIYHKQLAKAVDKVNQNSSPIWDLFAIPIRDPRSIGC